MSADEVIDVLTASGKPLGRASRREVHAEGRWHQTFHCLVVRSSSPATVVLQRRHRAATAFPGLLDLSATGHLLSGESPTDGVREIDEELGIEVDRDELVPLGVRLLADDNGEGQNRERVHVFLLSDDRPIDRFAPDPNEVEGLVEVRADELLSVLAGLRATVPGLQWRPGQPVEKIEILTDDLIQPIDGYWAVMLVMAERFVAGQLPLAV